MRIRNSEKLLGFASEYRRAPSPPSPWDSAAAIVAAAGLLCEINRSSCAEVSINLQSSNYQKEGLEISNEEKEKMDIAGKSSDDKEEEVKPEEKIGDNEEIKNEKEPARKRREKEVEATGMTKCKKMNDEGCHCNLSQLSSYLPRSEEQISGIDRGSGIASNSYDDYCVLGIDSRETTSRGNKSSALADRLNGADEEAIGSANLCNFNYKKKMKPLKKRGRKPMKARSLKSLLSFRVC
ncbi:uncharacterized protein LOC110097667 [Dendrobium catenatum]|uniref:Uncharacterized protein n=1 Tax=Dendrobium catenatum TaxID=906689 RepID=A0A2I0VWX8_9ASPA|nr:uncharacterized protein LOC110097667 [Dendrobium catenatum]PKU67905.1 hypothetical protein MA16_Dca006940 [Dendrobium catenatum]